MQKPDASGELEFKNASCTTDPGASIKIEGHSVIMKLLKYFEAYAAGVHRGKEFRHRHLVDGFR